MKNLITFGLFLALLIPGLIRAETFYVPDDFLTISDAYSAVTSIDTICLRDGNFYDNIVIGSKDITIVSGSGSEYTYLRPLDSLEPVIYGFSEELQLGTVSINGVTFDSTVVSPAIDLTRLSSPGLVVDSCRFLDNSSSLIIKLRESDYEMKNCLMRDNNGNLLDLFSFEGAGEITLKSNSFVANDGQVLFRLYGSDCYLHDNIFELNDCDTCCMFDADGLLVVDSCRWSQNSASALLCLQYCQAGVNVYANDFIGNNSSEIVSASSSGGIYRNNLFADNQNANILGLAGPVSLTRIDSNTFTANQLIAQANLVHIDCGVNNEDIIVSDNIFENNSADSGAIIYFRAGGFCKQDVLRNGFHFNNSGGPSILRLITGAGAVSENVFDSNQVGAGAILSFDSYPMFGVPQFNENIFTDNLIDSGKAVLWLNFCRRDCVLKSNLFYKNSFENYPGEALAVSVPDRAIICLNNLIAENANCTGISLSQNPGYTDSIRCNNSWSNGLADYFGFSPDSTNVSCDPMFCEPGAGQFGVADLSCCLPENNLCGELIGPFDAGCRFAQITQISIENEASMLNVVNHQPEFYWSYSAYSGFMPTRYEIELGADSNWQEAELWDPSVVISADTHTQYTGSPLSDGQTYYLRLRIGDSLNWSEWGQSSFRMNSNPGIPRQLNPYDSASTGAQPKLYLLNSDDPDGDPLFYEFMITDDFDQVVTVSPSVAENPDSTAWLCDMALTEDYGYNWKVRADDTFEKSSWSEKTVFYVNSVNTAPASFDLVFPPDSNGIPLAELSPVFTWTNAFDPDPLDTVSYTVYLSEDSSFNQFTQYSGLTDTVVALPDSLEPASSYWWKVRAYDLLQDETWSSASLSFSTMKCGDVNMDRAVEISDAVYIINYIFLGGGEPAPLQSADVNCDSSADLSDAFYIINFIFMGGSPPCDLDSNGEFDC